MTTRKRAAGERSSGPTLQTIAELAGCSLMTVSRALNGGTVSPENAARVKQAAEALGYVPNVAAQRMRGGRTRTIGVLINVDFDPRTEIMVILDCLIREMENAGNQVLVSIARGGPQQNDAHLRGFIGRGVDGLFYWNAHPSPFLERYQRAGIPVVAMAFRHEDCRDLPLVSFDAVPTFVQIYRRLAELGHRVGVELMSPRQPAMYEYYDTGGDVRWRRYDLGFDRADLVEFVKAVRADPDPPTVVMGDYPRAAQLLGVCEDLGVRVPEDLSVISIVEAVANPLLRTPLASIRSDYEAMGLAASKSMLAAIDGAEVEDVFVPGGIHWIERASVGPAPRTPAPQPRSKPAASVKPSR